MFVSLRRLALASVVLSLTAAPAFAAHTAEHAASAPVSIEVSPINDPIEPFNRAVFQFNDFIDTILLKPVTSVYDFILPQFVRNGIHNLLINLGAPIVMANSLFQGDFDNFELTLHRFVVNTTLGLGGLNDVATALKMPASAKSDFGQTMGVWGAGHGFYLVLPIIGPSSARDGAGRIVDIFADPFNVRWNNSENEKYMYARAGAAVVNARSRAGDAYDDVMKNAVDPYVTFRSIYVQQRAYMVQNRASDSYGAAEAE